MHDPVRHEGRGAAGHQGQPEQGGAGMAEATLTAAGQVRVQHRRHQADHQERRQARHQWPEAQADFPQRPDDGGAEHQRHQAGAQRLAPGIEHTGQQHAQAGQQVVPRAAEGGQAHTADRQGQATEAEQGTEDIKGKAS